MWVRVKVALERIYTFISTFRTFRCRSAGEGKGSGTPVFRPSCHILSSSCDTTASMGRHSPPRFTSLAKSKIRGACQQLKLLVLNGINTRRQAVAGETSRSTAQAWRIPWCEESLAIYTSVRESPLGQPAAQPAGGSRGPSTPSCDDVNPSPR